MKGTVPKVLVAVVPVVAVLATLINCNRVDSTEKVREVLGVQEQTAAYVGRENCKECHQMEYDLFQGSDHDMAMDTAIARPRPAPPDVRVRAASVR